MQGEQYVVQQWVTQKEKSAGSKHERDDPNDVKFNESSVPIEVKRNVRSNNSTHLQQQKSVREGSKKQLITDPNDQNEWLSSKPDIEQIDEDDPNERIEIESLA